MIDIVFIVIALYFLYKFIFNFLLPVSQVTSDMRSRVKQAQENQMNVNKQQSSGTHTRQSANTEKEGQYIDFEEIR